MPAGVAEAAVVPAGVPVPSVVSAAVAVAAVVIAAVLYAAVAAAAIVRTDVPTAAVIRTDVTITSVPVARVGSACVGLVLREPADDLESVGGPAANHVIVHGDVTDGLYLAHAGPAWGARGLAEQIQEALVEAQVEILLLRLPVLLAILSADLVLFPAATQLLIEHLVTNHFGSCLLAPDLPLALPSLILSPSIIGKRFAPYGVSTCLHRFSIPSLPTGVMSSSPCAYALACPVPTDGTSGVAWGKDEGTGSLALLSYPGMYTEYTESTVGPFGGHRVGLGEPGVSKNSAENRDAYVTAYH